MQKDCFNCENCLYIGEGDSICDFSFALVLDDWEPTDEFMICAGKDWTEK